VASNADWANKDFYKVLGVDKDAEAAAIKKAYRKLAREHHPDSKPGDKAAEERFKQVAEAYDVIGDAEKRKEYDQMRSMFAGGFPAGGGGGFNFPGGFSGGTTTGGFDISDLFGNLFGGGAAGTRGSSRRATRGADLETEATIDFTDAVEGTTVALRMSSDAACHLQGHRRQARHHAARLPDVRRRRHGGQQHGRGVLAERDLPGVPRAPARVRRVLPDLPRIGPRAVEPHAPGPDPGRGQGRTADPADGQGRAR